MKYALLPISEEIKDVNLPDKRLKKRASSMLEQFYQTPNKSIPQTFRGRAELKAAYRFFDQECVMPQTILKPHTKETIKRIDEHGLVLLINDSTDLDMDHMEEVKELGVLNDKKTPGCMIHSLIAFTPEKLCLGSVATKFIVRTPKELGKKTHNNLRPIEEKESYRWIEDYRQACKIARGTSSHIVYVADREADIYELFLEADANQNVADLLVRGTHLNRKVLLDGGKEISLLQAIDDSPVLGILEFSINSTNRKKTKKGHENSKKSRQVTQEVRVLNVTLTPSSHKKNLPKIRITAVYLQEVGAPKGVEPINWLLLTTLKTETLEDVKNLTNLYLSRWGIETFFHILKTGCLIEELQFDDAANLLPCITMYLIVAWRVMYVTMLGRTAPDIPCDLVFEEDEWQCAYAIIKKKKPPKQPPSLKEMISIIATMGGHLGRKSDGAPGPKVMWMGLQRLYANTEGWSAYKDLIESS